MRTLKIEKIRGQHPVFLCRSAQWVSWAELRTRDFLSRRTVGPWQPFSHRQSGVRRPDGVRWGHRSGTGHSGHQIGAPALCDSIVECIPMLVFCRFRPGYSGLSRLARRRRRKVWVSNFDLCAFDSERVVRGCSVIETEQPRPTHWSPNRLGTMELCQLALVARRKTPGPAGRIGHVEATKQSPRAFSYQLGST